MSLFYEEPDFLLKMINLIKVTNMFLHDKNREVAESYILERTNEIIRELANNNVGFYNIICEKSHKFNIDENTENPLIDGTFMFSVSECSSTCSISVVIFGDPVFGIVGDPKNKSIYYGIKNVGSYKIGNEKYEECEYPGYKLVIPKNKTINQSLAMENDERWKSMHPSLKLCAIAEGSVNYYFHSKFTFEWEICAADVVVRNAGGGVYIYNPNETNIRNYKNMLKYDKCYLKNPLFVTF